jgi:large subunit ribosomal protein L10
MATRTQKDQQIQELIEEIRSTSVFYLADTSELNALATSNLRRECHKNGIRLRVVKNSLLRKAMEGIEGKDYSSLFPGLTGATSLMIAEKGNGPAKVIEAFRKKHPKPLLKSAWVDEAVFIGDENLSMLSKLKGKEELIGDIILLLQSPIKNVIGGLQSSAGQKIAGIVKTLEERAS